MVNWCTVEKVSPTELFDWVEGVRSGVSAWIMSFLLLCGEKLAAGRMRGRRSEFFVPLFLHHRGFRVFLDAKFFLVGFF